MVKSSDGLVIELTSRTLLEKNQFLRKELSMTCCPVVTFKAGATLFKRSMRKTRLTFRLDNKSIRTMIAHGGTGYTSGENYRHDQE